MKKWNLVIDVARCENCNNCVLATKDEHVDNNFPGYSAPQPRHGHEWIQIKRKMRGSAPMVDVSYVPVMCNHCDVAPCVNAAKNGAAYKRDDGITIIDPEKAKGQQDLVKSCPYQAIHWNDEQKIPQIWTFDAHLLDQGWKEPRCTQACPTGAMRALHLSDEDMSEIARRDALEVLQPELDTKPRVYYKNLHRYAKCFVGGSVISSRDNAVDCVSDASVILLKDERRLRETFTDTFGDFKFDALEPSSGAYLLEIKHGALGHAVVSVNIGQEAVYLGEISLSPNSAG